MKCVILMHLYIRAHISIDSVLDMVISFSSDLKLWDDVQNNRRLWLCVLDLLSVPLYMCLIQNHWWRKHICGLMTQKRNWPSREKHKLQERDRSPVHELGTEMESSVSLRL